MFRLGVVCVLVCGSTACEVDFIDSDWEEEALRSKSSAEDDKESCADLWQWPMECEVGLDGELSLTEGRETKSYDVDFERGADSSIRSSGFFDGPYGFNGSWSASMNWDGSQTLNVTASGHGESMDITLRVDANCEAGISGEANGIPVSGPVTVEGDGSLSNPYSVTVGDCASGDCVEMEWTTECGELR